MLFFKKYKQRMGKRGKKQKRQRKGGRKRDSERQTNKNKEMTHYEL